MGGELNKLSEEKKMAVICAALEVFGINEYKRASTDLIAAKAGISKGLLFYYFKNKKELYRYLLEYVEEQVKPLLLDAHFFEITDFFELLAYSTGKKAEILSQYPYLLEFTVRAFYSEREDVSEDMKNLMQNELGNMFQTYFKNIRLDKFRPEADPQEVLNMLVWLTDGYMHQKLARKEQVNMQELMDKFREWSDMLKSITYQEKYL